MIIMMMMMSLSVMNLGDATKALCSSVQESSEVVVVACSGNFNLFIIVGKVQVLKITLTMALSYSSELSVNVN